jgi:acetyl esterase
VRWPARRTPAPPLLVWFTDGDSAAELAATGVVVISIRPRSFPTAREVLEWSATHATALGAAPGQLLVGGDGSGAALAAMVARHAREQGWPRGPKPAATS